MWWSGEFYSSFFLLSLVLLSLSLSLYLSDYLLGFHLDPYSAWELQTYLFAPLLTSFFSSAAPLFLRNSKDAYIKYQIGERSLCLTQYCRDDPTPNGCPTSTTPIVCSPDQKGAQEVCKPTGGSILARMGRVQDKRTVMIGLIHACFMSLHYNSYRGHLLSIFEILKPRI